MLCSKRLSSLSPQKKLTAGRTIKPVAPLLVSATILMAALQASAGPEGGVVKGGAGSINRNGNTTTIEQATDRMAIDWSSYDVAADERVQYVQPDSSSISLNRIMSNTGSEIHGRIEANGQVILVNPHGILFGESAVVNAGGIMATGLSIDADDFMNGDFTFRAIEGTDGVVINSGLLNAATGGNVTLLGKEVKNTGLISANLGSATFAAGREAYVTFDAEGLVGVRITKELLEEDIGVDAAVINEGVIRAEDGQVLLTASVSQDIFSQAMNTGDMDYGGSVVVHDDGSFTLGGGADVVNTGTIDVSGNSGGAVVLLGENVTHSGEVLADATRGDSLARVELHSVNTLLTTGHSVIQANATGGRAGDIKLLGEKVGILGESSIQASGLNGGGYILIGGDLRGGNARVRNASAVYFGEAAEINADAMQWGRAGEVILYSQDILRAYGNISARGYAHASGGFVETSSHIVDLDLNVDVFGAEESGQWLIDPWNITIGGTTNEIRAPYLDGGVYIFEPQNPRSDLNDQSDSIISMTSLQNALDSQSHVRIETIDGNTPAGQVGNITLAQQLDYDTYGGGTLTLDAHNDININAAIGDFGGAVELLNLNFVAGGDINIASGVSITTGGGYLHTEGVNFNLGTPGSAASINTDGGAVTMLHTGDVNLYGNVTTNGGTFTVGSESQRVASFTSAWDSNADGVFEGIATIDTSSNTSLLGHASIFASGDINLGKLTVGSASTVGATSIDEDDWLKITLDSNSNVYQQSHVNFEEIATSADYLTLYEVQAGGSITIGKDARYDNENGGNLSNILLNADDDVLLVGDLRDNNDQYFDANLYTSGGTITVSGRDLIIGGSDGSRGQLNAEGGDIDINMTGDINVYDNESRWNNFNSDIHSGTEEDYWDKEGASPIRSAHGNITINGSSFTANGFYSISTHDDTNLSTASIVSITTTNGNATLGTINLRNSQANATTNTDLFVHAHGDILQGTGNLLVSGLTELSTDQGAGNAAGNITLNSATNNFERGLLIVHANDVVITDLDSIEFAGYNGNPQSQIDGDLTVTTGGEITDSASLAVAGLASFSAEGHDITLNSGGNDFNALRVTGRDVVVMDLDDVVLGNSSVANYSITSGGSITDADSEVIAVSSNLNIAAQTGTGESAVYYDVTLDNNHRVSNFQIVGANDVTIKDTDGSLEIGNTVGTSYVAGNLNVTATGGQVWDEDSNKFTVDGIFSITALGRSVDLSNFDNTYGELSVDTHGSVVDQSGGQITIKANSLVVRDLSALGNGSGASNNIFITIANSYEQLGNIQADEVSVTENNNAANSYTISAGSEHTTNSYSIDARGGNDAFYVAASTQAQLNGENDTDTFYIESGDIHVPNINGGNGAQDSIIGPDVDVWWTTSNSGVGSLDFDGVENNPNPKVSFVSVEKVTGGSGVDTMDIRHDFYSVSGGQGDDVITLSSGAHLDNSLYGGAGADTITISSSDVVVSGGIFGGSLDGTDTAEVNGETVTGIDTFIGYNAGENETVLWSIVENNAEISLDGNDAGSEADSNTQNAFSQFEVLKGNDANDGFNVDKFTLVSAAFVGELYGGVDEDEFVINGSNASVKIYGDGGDDYFELNTSTFAGEIDGGSESDQFDISAVGAATLAGGAGNDVFDVEATSGGLTLFGNTGADQFNMNGANLSLAVYGNDAVNIDDGDDAINDTLTGYSSASDNNKWHFGVDNNGAVQDAQQLVSGSGTITFDGIQIVQGGSEVDEFYLRQAYTGEIKGGAKNDMFHFYVTPEDYTPSASANIKGEAGDDQFIIYNANNNIKVNVDGGENGKDTLGFASGTNTWSISAATVASGGEVSEYSDIEVLQGGDGVDTFNIDAYFSGKILGEAGNDIFNISAVVSDSDASSYDIFGGSDADTFNILSGAFTESIGIDGGYDAPPADENDPVIDDDTIVGFGVATTWSVTGEDQGNIDLPDGIGVEISFSEIENITGADDVVDSFIFSAGGDISGEIDGGAGDLIKDILDFSASGTEKNFVLSGTTGLGNLTGVELIKASDAADLTNSLDASASGFYSWVINGAFKGSVTDGSTTIDFENFHVLIGSNDLGDLFTFSDTDGTGTMRRIYGSGGDDWVNYLGLARAIDVIVDRDVLFADDTILDTDNNRLSGIEWVVGNAGQNSTLTYRSIGTSTTTDQVTWTLSDYAETPLVHPFTGSEIDVDGINDGTVTGNGTTVSFIDFAALTGGDGDDTFQFGVGGQIGSVDGASGSDTLVGRKEDDLETTEWFISEENGGGVEWSDEDWVVGDVDLTFSNIENLEGRDDVADTFTFEESADASVQGDITGSIDAGDVEVKTGVVDIVDYSGVSKDQNITIGDSELGISVEGVERIIANAGQVNSLTGNNIYYQWEISDYDDAVGSTVNGVNDGVLRSSDSSPDLQFENFQTLIGSDADDQFTIGNGTIGSIQGGGGNNTLTGRVAATTWTISGANSGKVGVTSGNDYVFAFSEIQNLEGQDAVVDTFNITATGMFDGTIDGGSGTMIDALSVATPTDATHANHRENRWDFTSGYTRVSRVNTDGVSSGTTTFTGLESLIGGTGNDVFTFDSLTDFSSLSIDAGDGVNGEDTLSLASLASLPASTAIDLEWVASGNRSAVKVVSVVTEVDDTLTKSTLASIKGIDKVVGRSGRDISLVAADGGPTEWTIGNDAANNPRYLENTNGRLDFSDIAHLVGNDAKDIFTIGSGASFAGQLDGGAGDNQLTWTADYQTWQLDADEAFAGQVGSTEFHGIHTLTGDNGSSVLVGRNQNNHWVIDGENDGYVQLAELDPSLETGADRIYFTDMYNLSGNVQRDRFEFDTSGRIVGDVRGTLQGSSDNNNDQLDFTSASTSTVTWTLASSVENGGHYRGSVTGNGFTNDFVDIEFFNGGAGIDTFSIQNPNFSATIDGGGNTDKISLTLNANSTWTIDGVNDAEGDFYDVISVTNGGAINVRNIEQGEGSHTGSDAFNVSAQVFSQLDGRGGNDTLTLDTSSTPNFNLSFIAGDGDDDEIVAGDGNNTWRIGGSGVSDNTLNYNASAGLGIKFNATLETMTGGSGDDNFVIASLGLNRSIAGGNGIGSDTLTGANTAVNEKNTWIIGGNSVAANTLNYVDAQNNGISFTEIENFTGGSGVDEFSLLGGSITGAVAGGGNTDTLTVNRNGVTSITNWLIDGANTGTVDGIGEGFTSIENLIGGDRVDAFVLGAAGSLAGLLQGAGHGSDTLDVTAKSDGIVVTLTTDAPANGATGLHVNTVETITAAADPDLTDSTDTEANNKLVNNLSGNFEWSITGRNTGELIQTGLNSITFVNFADLQAGDNDDTFSFNSGSVITKAFDGGGAFTRDTIDLSGYSGSVEVAVDSSQIHFSETNISTYGDIEHIIGNNNGQDAANTDETIFSIANGSNTWIIDDDNAGEISHTGLSLTFADVNVLKGGAGADTFNITSDGWISGHIDGGSDTNPDSEITDTVNATGISGPVNVQLDGEGSNKLNIFNIESLLATGAGNSLEAASTGTHDWQIESNGGKGRLNTSLSFEGFQTLIGNDSNDSFSLASGVTITNVFGRGGSDSLEVDSNSSTFWEINGNNSGSVGDNNNNRDNRVDSFTSIEYLTGSDSQDTFIFTNAGDLSGVIDGGEAVNGNVNDVLDVEAFQNGVIVALGETVYPGVLVETELVLTQVNVNNVERINAYDHNPETGENNNWLAIAHTRNIYLRMNSTNQASFNDGYVVEGTASEQDLTSRVDFYNFGSIQGGGGLQDTNISTLEDDNSNYYTANLTGSYNRGSGLSIVDYSEINDPDNPVVVDINPQLVKIIGNDNTLIRIVSSETQENDLNGDNAWLINAINAGTLTASYWGEDGYSLEFSGVNMLQGGTGKDLFTFDDGLLIDGGINGGAGENHIIVSSAQADMVFGYSHLVSSPLNDDQIAASYPNTLVDDVYTVINRDDVIDFVNVESLTVTSDYKTTLVSDDTGSFSWTIGSNTGVPQTQQVLTNNSNQDTVLFSGVDVVRGGDADDYFSIRESGIVSNFVNTGGGNDEVDVSLLPGALDILLSEEAYTGDTYTPNLVLNGAETLTTSTNAHRLIAENQENQWLIDGTNSGTIAYTNTYGAQTMRFSSMHHLVGGSNTDTFTLADGGLLTGTVDGGSQTDPGRDRLVLAANATQALTAQISARDAVTGLVIDTRSEYVDIAGIEQIDANTNGQPHALLARTDTANTWTVGTTASTLAFGSESVQFSNFYHLTGGAAQDAFTFNGAIVSGLIDGGDNTVAAVDSVTLNGINNRIVHIGERVTGDINLTHIESVVATGSTMTLMGDDLANTWDINNPLTNAPHQLTQTLADASQTQIAFGGFTHLTGGSQADVFQVNANEAITEVTHFSGGAGSADTLDITALTDAVSVSRDPNYTATFIIDSIEQVDAADNGNTLVGSNAATNTWRVTDTDTGSLSASGQTTGFTGFSHLQGGDDQIDIFEFEQNGNIVGLITGLVDGGGQPQGQRDRVDMSGLDSADVVIGDTTGFANIEEYQGKGTTSTITAADVRNTWTITGNDTGNIVDANGNDIRFIDFGILNGGTDVDIFHVNSGGVSGQINAGGARDELYVDLGAGRNGVLTFNGNADSSTIDIIGGSEDARFNTTYYANTDGSAALVYDRSTDTAAYSYRVNYTDASTVGDAVYSNVMAINPVTGQADTITIADNSVEVDGFARVDIDNKNSVDIQGEVEDHLIILGRISVADYFAVRNVSMETQGANAGITANRKIIFNNTSGVGSADARLNISTTSLVLNTPRSDVYLAQTGSLDIAEMNVGNSVVDIESTGSITDSGDLSTLGDLRLLASGDITLDNSNTLSGLISLQGNNQITLNNGATRLGDVQAQNFILNTRANVDAEGTLTIANTTRVNGADSSVIDFSGEGHQFNRVIVDNAGTLVLDDSSANGVVVEGNVRDAFTINAIDAVTANAITASDITLNAANDSVTVQSGLIAKNSVQLQGTNVDVNAGIAVTESTAEQAVAIDAGNGNVNVRASIVANEILPGNIIIEGGNIVQYAGAPIRGRDVKLNSQSDLSLQSHLDATQDLTFTATGSIDMAPGIRAEASTLDMQAGTGLTLEQLVGNTITLITSSGNITQNGDITAGSFSATTKNGTFDSNAGTTLNFDDELIVDARAAEVAGRVNSANGTATFVVANNVLLNGEIEASDVKLTAGGELAMSSNTASQIRSSNIMDLSSGAGMQLTRLDGQAGTVKLTAGGAITDHNGDAVNIIADNLIATANAGFGTYDREGNIETSVGQIDVRNQTGGMGVVNDRDLTVNALITNEGDIRLVNTEGNVVMANALRDTAYDRSAIGTDVRQAGGVIDAHYGLGNIVIEVQDGYLGATPGPHYERPELIGDVIEVSTSDGFGVDARQLVVYAKTQLILHGRGIRPIWAFREEPLLPIQTDSDLIDPSIVGSVNELLINVERAEDVDPAIFTDVRNYSYSNIAIRLPRDQLYDSDILDDDEEDREGEAF